MDTTLWFRWLGVAGIELTIANKTLVIDPFFTRPPAWRLVFGRLRPDHELIIDKLPYCDFVLVSHAHYDHMMDVADLMRSRGAVAIASRNTCDLLGVCGIPQEQVRRVVAGDGMRLRQFWVEVLPATHERIFGWQPASGELPHDLRSPLRAQDYRMDSQFSFAIRLGKTRLLYWLGMRCDGAPAADVLFVMPHKPRLYYERLLRTVRPRIVIPIHWDDFFRPLSKPIRPMLLPTGRWLPPLRRVDLARFRRTVAEVARGTRVLIPRILHAYDIRHEARG